MLGRRPGYGPVLSYLQAAQLPDPLVIHREFTPGLQMLEGAAVLIVVWVGSNVKSAAMG